MPRGDRRSEGLGRAVRAGHVATMQQVWGLHDANAGAPATRTPAGRLRRSANRSAGPRGVGTRPVSRCGPGGAATRSSRTAWRDRRRRGSSSGPSDRLAATSRDCLRASAFHELRHYLAFPAQRLRRRRQGRQARLRRALATNAERVRPPVPIEESARAVVGAVPGGVR